MDVVEISELLHSKNMVRALRSLFMGMNMVSPQIARLGNMAPISA